eukprot:scaffold3685_cov23-Cyclotella_meneghiniana.AAC.2
MRSRLKHFSASTVFSFLHLFKYSDATHLALTSSGVDSTINRVPDDASGDSGVDVWCWGDGR